MEAVNHIEIQSSPDTNIEKKAASPPISASPSLTENNESHSATIAHLHNKRIDQCNADSTSDKCDNEQTNCENN